jgi:hypothetical protein
MTGRSTRVGLLVVVALGFGGVLLYRLLHPGHRGSVLAYTECPFRGDSRVTVAPGVAPEDTFPVRMHEEVHAAQCRELGPLRYRLRNLSTSGRMALEIPGYCAGARARLKQGMTLARVRERVLDDARAALGSARDSASIAAGLLASCPDVFR